MSALVQGITLMEASAGTGKTFRIAHRVLRLVAEEADLTIDQVLVVTFTEAATAELKDRVRSRLRDGLRGLEAKRDGRAFEPPDEHLEAFVAGADPNTAIPRLRTALVDFDLAPISTIHGFCNRMLKRHAFESGAAFDAELVAGLGPEVRRLVTDFYLSQVHDAPPTFLDAFQAAGLSLGDLENLASKVLDPDLEVIPEADLVAQPDLGDWFEACRAFRVLVERDVGSLHATLTNKDHFHQTANRAHGITSYPVGRTRSAISNLDQWSEAPSLLSAMFEHWELFTLDHFNAAVRDAATPVPEVIQRFDSLIALRSQFGAELHAWLLGLKCALIGRVKQEIPTQAQDDNKRTYNDLLIDLRDALVDPHKGPGLRASIREHYKVALIDEFQDTDPVQWAIFQSVFSERMCLIGDPKQAIYRFRGADVHTYLAAADSADRTVPLPTNFRSDKLLLDAVNHLYCRADEPFGANGPAYERVDPHHPERRLLGDPRPPLHIRYLARERPARLSYYNTQLNRYWLNDQLPIMVANDIAAELHLGLLLAGKPAPRKVSPGDCAVLVAANWQAEKIQDALRTKGIPSVRRGRDAVFDSPACKELTLVLEGVLAPADRSAVCAALSCALMDRNGDDFRVLEQDDRAWSDTVGRFRTWHALWVDDGFVRMFHAWLDGDLVVERLLRSGAERLVTDLLHLGELLHDASATGPLGPAGLVEWLRGKGTTADPDEAAIRLESDADAVKIYTMHSAKGLEWPLVWCPYLCDGVYLRDDDAMHTKFYDHDKGRWRLDIGSDDHDTHRQMKLEEDLEEDMRLAYVALTRARHRCIVYWGIAGGNKSGLGYLLHQVPGASDLARSAFKRTDRDADVIADLQAHAKQPGIGFDVVDWASEISRSEPRWQPDPLGDRELRKRAITRKQALDTWWRRSSFSDLCRRSEPGHGEDPPRADDKDEAEEREPTEKPGATEGGELVLLHDLRGGTQIGTCIHKIFEEHDFQAPDELEGHVREQLTAHGFDASKWAELVRQDIQDVLDTPLEHGPGAFRLNQLPKRKRLDELHFHFPVIGGFDAHEGQVTAKALAAAFGSDLGPGAPKGIAERIRSLSFLPVRGFMHGFIDLVLEHGGKWYVVDWKSNKLGQHHTDYGTELLRHKMLESNYVLQYHLYLVALHRYLKWRLGEDTYDYDTHVGGAWYLFTRGMAPKWGPDFGVFHDRPTKALIERLDDLFRGGGSP